jgi:L-threonylcarbamoyladenylate synthase
MKIVREFTIEEVVGVLENGEVVAAPTDTVYGLLADATNEEVVEKVFQIKGREKGKALPVFVRDIEMAKELAEISAEQEKFLKENWPGKVTAVLESKHVLPKALELNGKVALRIPDYELINELLDRPLTGTSANVSGQPPCSSAQAVIKQFEERDYQPDLVLDAGELPKSNPSKVVDITGDTEEIIRP